MMGFGAGPHGSQAGAESSSLSTITGTVRVLDRNGNEHTDHSGVVVFVDGLNDSVVAEPSPEPPQVSHKGRQFWPKVLPLVRGETVDFYNDDNIYHNVFSLSKPKTFDLGIYPEGTSKLVTFNEPGLVKIYCNIHPKMVSTILVLNNDLFATTGRDGTFRISAVPSGEVTLRVWSEFSQEQHRVLTLGNGEIAEQSFDVRETKRFVQHRDKFGRRYREKY